MKIKMIQLDGIMNNLSILTEKEIPIKTAYQLSILLDSISKEYNKYNKLRGKLIFKYAEKDGEGKIITNEDKSIKLQKDVYEACEKELIELNNIEVDIDFTPISIDSLGDIEVKPQDLLALKNFIKY